MESSGAAGLELVSSRPVKDQPRVVTIVGNPKPRSRTYRAAERVTRDLAGRGPDLQVDITDLGPAVLDWHDTDVSDLVELLSGATLAVVASPTYKGTYSGLLKLFLDRIGTGRLRGVTAVPLMVGASERHALAPELLLKPVLVELGATCPTPGLFLLESQVDDASTWEEWRTRAGREVWVTTGEAARAH